MNVAYPKAWLDLLVHDLDGYPEGQARHARATIHTVLQDRRSDNGSKLTGDGYPLELSFATATREARWTADPWHPSTHCAPVDCMLAACERLGLATDRLSRLAHLGFGGDFAWIGGRSGSTDRFKLYLSCPEIEDQPRVLETAFGQSCPRPAISASVRMVAIDPLGSGGEVYWRASPIAQQLSALLLPAEAVPSGPALVSEIERLWGHRVRDRLPGGSVGVSFTVGDRPTRATLYLFVKALWGSDAAIRRRWLARSDLDQRQRRAYQHATGGLTDRHSCLTWHAMIGLHFGGAGYNLSLGVRPERAA